PHLEAVAEAARPQVEAVVLALLVEEPVPEALLEVAVPLQGESEESLPALQLEACLPVQETECRASLQGKEGSHPAKAPVCLEQFRPCYPPTVPSPIVPPPPEYDALIVPRLVPRDEASELSNPAPKPLLP